MRRHNTVVSHRKILAISDTRDPLVYSTHIKERYHDIDLVLSAGDIDLPFYGFIVSSLNKPLGFVFGNHNLEQIKYFRKEYDDAMYLEPFPHNYQTYGAIYLGGKVKQINGVLIAGLGGSMRYNKGKNQFTELKMLFYSLKILPWLLLNRIIHGRFLDILLTHAPPRNINDLPDRCHRGFKVFRLLMRIFKPRYLLHGHVHLYDLNAPREYQYGDTRVINIYSHYILEMDI